MTDAAAEYNYTRFHPGLMVERFVGGPKPGEMAPDFSGSTLEGREVRLSNFRGRRHVVLQFGSVTCPMTAAAASGTERVRQEFQGDDVEFLLVYVREAHPGEHVPAHTTLEQKKHGAIALVKHEDIHTTVVLDDLEGTIHRAYGLQPNNLYVIDKGGRVVFRALWAEEGVLRRTLIQLLEGEQEGHRTVRGENLSILIPFLHGMGELPRVLDRAGPQAVGDFEHVVGRTALFMARGLSLLRPILRASPRVRAALLGGVALGMLVVILAGG